MVTLSVIILGFASATNIPTALMPDISIPEITINVDYPDNTARDIENNVVRTLRSRLLQIDGLTNLKTESRDGSATIDLSFEYGLDMNLAYIETNEKIDIALNQLPRDLQRPKVIKASATDIPVQNITITPISKDSKFFLEVSELTETIIKKRIEQLPHVALADITGLERPEIFIEPDAQLTRSLGISNSDIIDAIESSNFKLGNIIVQNGIYQYNLSLSEPLKSVSDIENIIINVNGHLLTLNEIANVQLMPQRERGAVLLNGKRSILISVIKQSNARAEDLKMSLSNLLADFEMTYPNLKFETHQDQTKLLKWSINNLKSSLIIGGGLSYIDSFFILRGT